MSRPWWVIAIQWIVWFAVMSLFMGWIARSFRRPRADGRDDVLEYPRSILVLGILGAAMGLGLAALGLLLGSGGESSYVLGISLFFVLMGAWLIVEYARVRFQLEPEGLRYQTMFGKRGILHWEEMQRVRYSEMARWFRIDGARGEVVRVSIMMTSLVEFAQTMLQRVPREHIDPFALEVLESTAAGSPPPVWG